MPQPMIKMEAAGDLSDWECDICGAKLEWAEFGDPTTKESELGLLCIESACPEKPVYQPYEVKEWYSPE